MSSTLDRRSVPSIAIAHTAPLVRLARTTARLLRAWRNRREIHRLGEMTEYELADIGLTRADLYTASSAPLGRDPTAELGVLAEARAFARQEAAPASADTFAGLTPTAFPSR